MSCNGRLYSLEETLEKCRNRNKAELKEEKTEKHEEHVNLSCQNTLYRESLVMESFSLKYPFRHTLIQKCGFRNDICFVVCAVFYTPNY